MIFNKKYQNEKIAKCNHVENQALPRPRVSKLRLALYGNPYNSLRSAALEVVWPHEGATRSVLKLNFRPTVFKLLLFRHISSYCKFIK